MSFRCNEVEGVALLERWIGQIEFHYSQCLDQPDFRMIVQIQNLVRFRAISGFREHHIGSHIVEFYNVKGRSA
jgi:hypothetical protein